MNVCKAQSTFSMVPIAATHLTRENPTKSSLLLLLCSGHDKNLIVMVVVSSLKEGPSNNECHLLGPVDLLQ